MKNGMHKSAWGVIISPETGISGVTQIFYNGSSWSDGKPRGLRWMHIGLDTIGPSIRFASYDKKVVEAFCLGALATAQVVNRVTGVGINNAGAMHNLVDSPS